MAEYPAELIPEQYRGDNYRVLSNGAIYDHSAGKITAKLPGSADITSEIARDIMPDKRAQAKARAQMAFRSGMGQAVGGSSLSAWRAIGQVQTELAQDKERGLSSTRAAEFVGKASGYLQSDDKGQSGGGLTLQLDAQVARRLIDRLLGANDADLEGD